jgi:hypothetical protein
MKLDIFGFFTAISLSSTTPVPQTREALPQVEEAKLPEIDFALLAATVRPETGDRAVTNPRFRRAASANA